MSIIARTISTFSSTLERKLDTKLGDIRRELTPLLTMAQVVRSEPFEGITAPSVIAGCVDEPEWLVFWGDSDAGDYVDVSIFHDGSIAFEARVGAWSDSGRGIRMKKGRLPARIVIALKRLHGKGP